MSLRLTCFCVYVYIQVPEAGWWCERTGWCWWPLGRGTAWGKTSRGSLPSSSMQACCLPRSLKKSPGSEPKRNKREIDKGRQKQKVSTAPKQVLLFSFISPLGIYLQGCGYVNWKCCFRVQINLEYCLCALTKKVKKCVKWNEETNKSMGAHTYLYSRKTPDPSFQSYYVLEQWVRAILSCIALLWQHVSSPSVERRRLTRELRVMASTTALKTLTGRRSSVVPLSTIALSMLYWKKGRRSEVQ